MIDAVVSSQPHPSPSGTSLEVTSAARLQPLVCELLKPATHADAAEAMARQLVAAQYENFSVISVLLPRSLRQDFCNVYAFCRVADDLGDELADRHESLRLLGQLREQTKALFAGRAESVLMLALAQTVRRHALPIDPFLDLISAFEQDQATTRYQNRDQLLDYCRRSANPVGRLVLLMCGYRDPERARLSDDICTALQLINFWQDVRRDLLDRDRIYLPAGSMSRFGVTEPDLRRQIDAGRCQPSVAKLIEYELNLADEMMARGRELLPMLRQSVRGQVSLFAAGGAAISRAIRRQRFDTLTRRPTLSRLQKGTLITAALATAATAAVTDAAIRLVGRKPAEASAAKSQTIVGGPA